jgi:hypothetical protein
MPEWGGRRAAKRSEMGRERQGVFIPAVWVCCRGGKGCPISTTTTVKIRNQLRLAPTSLPHGSGAEPTLVLGTAPTIFMFG